MMDDDDDDDDDDDAQWLKVVVVWVETARQAKERLKEAQAAHSMNRRYDGNDGYG